MEFVKYLTFLIPLAISILLFLYFRFKIGKDSSRLLIQSFILGMFSMIPVLFIQMFAAYLELDSLTSIRRIIFYAVVIMAFSSELFKFLAFRIFIYPKGKMSNPVDGIVYAVMIAMGFATLNNLMYFITLPNLAVSTVNAVTSGPANVIFGILMGFFIGLGKMRKMRFIDSMTGLVAAIFFHGLYDFCLLTKDYRLLGAFFAGSVLIALSLSITAIRLKMDEQQERV